MRNIWISCGYITKAHKVPEKGFSPIRFPFGVINFLESHVLRLYTSLSATPAYCERDRIRTYGQQIRNLLLYPTELPIRLRSVRDSNPWASPWQGDMITNFTNTPFEPKDGIEPPTYWLQISCSTSWATRAYIVLGTGFEPVLPPWKGGDLTLSRIERLRKVKDGCVDIYFYDWLY